MILPQHLLKLYYLSNVSLPTLINSKNVKLLARFKGYLAALKSITNDTVY